MSDQQTPKQLIKVCAWCPGLNPGRTPENTTHGICAQCFARVVGSEPPPGVEMAPSADVVDHVDPDAIDCDECERSNGPNYRGPCVHRGTWIDFHD